MQLQAFNYTDKLNQVPQATVMFFTALATHYTPTTFVSVPAIRFIFLPIFMAAWILKDPAVEPVWLCSYGSSTNGEGHTRIMTGSPVTLT
jgi:hypothetical protein